LLSFALCIWVSCVKLDGNTLPSPKEHVSTFIILLQINFYKFNKALVKSTLSAIPVHTAIAISVSPSIYRAIDKLQCSFISTDSDAVCGGRCLVR
jgi:hypothetical protein